VSLLIRIVDERSWTCAAGFWAAATKFFLKHDAILRRVNIPRQEFVAHKNRKMPDPAENTAKE